MPSTAARSAAGSARTGVMSLNTTPGWGKSGMSRMRARRAETSTTPAYRRFFLRGRGGMTVPDDVVVVVAVVLPEVAFGFGRALAAATPAGASLGKASY